METCPFFHGNIKIKEGAKQGHVKETHENR